MPDPQDERTSLKKNLRARLLADRERYAGSEAAAAAQSALGSALIDVLQQIEPELIGLYWPVRSEFNAAPALRSDKTTAKLPLALPFAYRTPPRMEYRRWSGDAPAHRDDYGIATTDGEVVVPDTVLVPCVGYTPEGYRIGYGGGFFDRWLAAHPHVTAIGIAWSIAQLAPNEFAPEPHDRPLTLIVTEAGVVG